MDKITAELLREKNRGERIDHQEWSAMVRAFKQQRTGDVGFIDEQADVRTSQAPGRPWFHCLCSEAIPEYSVLSLSAGTVVNGYPQLTAAKITQQTQGSLLTNGPFAGTVSGGCYVRFIDSWDPVLLKLNGDLVDVGDTTGPQLNTFEVGESGIGLEAITDEDPNFSGHQWFVKNTARRAYLSAGPDNNTLDNGDLLFDISIPAGESLHLQGFEQVVSPVPGYKVLNAGYYMLTMNAAVHWSSIPVEDALNDWYEIWWHKYDLGLATNQNLWTPKYYRLTRDASYSPAPVRGHRSEFRSARMGRLLEEGDILNGTFKTNGKPAISVEEISLTAELVTQF